jgi:GT2 family glycosyltransferase
MSPPVCSVLIANYNGAHLIEECIESVLAQDCDFEVEIIIHDDASTDSSVKLICSRYPQIRLIESRKNVGFSISNNRMAAVARGEYLLLLNNDAALATDALTTLHEQARRQLPQGILTLPQHDWVTGQLVDRGCLLDPFYNPVPNLDPERTDVAMVIGACLWIPRTLWDALGGFPEWFESIAEDMYLCCRARLAGNPVQVTTSSFYRHRQGVSFGGNRVDSNRLASTYRRRRLSERNKTFVMVLCSPPLRLWLTLPLHLLLLAAEGLLLSIIKLDARVWKEIYANVFTSLVNQANNLRKNRRQIQSLTGMGRKYSDYGRSFTWMPRKLQLLIKHGVPNLR